MTILHAPPTSLLFSPIENVFISGAPGGHDEARPCGHAARDVETERKTFLPTDVHFILHRPDVLIKGLHTAFPRPDCDTSQIDLVYERMLFFFCLLPGLKRLMPVVGGEKIEKRIDAP